jgi:hypothetical protein
VVEQQVLLFASASPAGQLMQVSPSPLGLILLVALQAPSRSVLQMPFLWHALVVMLLLLPLRRD